MFQKVLYLKIFFHKSMFLAKTVYHWYCCCAGLSSGGFLEIHSLLLGKWYECKCQWSGPFTFIHVTVGSKSVHAEFCIASLRAFGVEESLQRWNQQALKAL
uniref:Uncharacterized protein n=1 Tax=Homalodisca liturata TaxID=320908 RepID=A0A1B6HCC3_9HEMI